MLYSQLNASSTKSKLSLANQAGIWLWNFQLGLEFITKGFYFQLGIHRSVWSKYFKAANPVTTVNFYSKTWCLMKYEELVKKKMRKNNSMLSFNDTLILISNSPYCPPHFTYSVCLENLVLDLWIIHSSPYLLDTVVVL